jgi:mono/diheme cytochrome c family protein
VTGAVGRFLAAGAVAIGIAIAPPAFADEESPEDLPPGKGRDEAFYGCTACHGFAIIRQQGMSRERWEATIVDMQVRHNMPELDPADRALVIDYLTAVFPPRQRGRPNPFAGR